MAEKLPHQEAYTTIGELVLIANALDLLLTRVLIVVLDLGNADMIMSVVLTLDPSRKIEMLKERNVHISAPEWKKKLNHFVKKTEDVFRARNIACHSTPVIVEDELVLQPLSTAKMLKMIDLKKNTLNFIPIKELRIAIEKAESLLSSGEIIIHNFARVNVEMAKRKHLKT